MELVLYDIVDTRRRNKVAQLCKDYCLFRIQKSCFLGSLPERKKAQFQKKISELIKEEDSIYISQMEKKQVKELEVFGKGFDKEMVMAQKNVLFLMLDKGEYPEVLEWNR